MKFIIILSYLFFFNSLSALANINTHESCSIVLEHINNENISDIEIPLEELRIDFDQDGYIDQVVSRPLGSSKSVSIGYIDRNGVFRMLGTCAGCASATTDAIKIIKVGGNLYGLNKESGRWAFTYPFLGTEKPQLCSFEAEYKPKLKTNSEFCHKIEKNNYTEVDFEAIKHGSGFDWNYALKEKQSNLNVRNQRPAIFLQSYPKLIDINNDGQDEQIAKIWIVWMGGRYNSKFSIIEIHDWENKTFDQASNVNNLLLELNQKLPFKKRLAEYKFTNTPIVIQGNTYISSYSKFHNFWIIHQIKGSQLNLMCEFDLENVYSIK